ncbi:hypothetical protein HZB04_01505 [Candidatus Wolfebacteria bacterium]|nr:hypothetical protein [Candidatus Wolfebacteria bacterium]
MPIIYARILRRNFYRNRILNSKDIQDIRLNMRKKAGFRICSPKNCSENFDQGEFTAQTPEFNVFLNDRNIETENQCFVIISCEFLKFCNRKSDFKSGECRIIIKTDLEGNLMIDNKAAQSQLQPQQLQLDLFKK